MKWERIVYSFTRKRRNDQPVVHERREGKSKHPDRGKASVAIVHIANHHSRITSGMPSQFETSRNTHLKARRNLEQGGPSTMPMKGILALRRKVPSEKISIRLSRQSLERARFRDKCPSLKVIQTGTKNARHFNAPPYDQRSKEWNERQEEFARHKAHKLHEALFKIKRHTTKMSTEQTSFLSYVPTKAKNTTTVSVIHSKEGTACGFVVSDTRALNLVLLLRGLQEKLRPHSCSYQTEGCTIH